MLLAKREVERGVNLEVKKRYYVSCNTGKRPWSEVSSIFLKAGCQELVQEGESPIHYYGIYLFEEDPRLEKLRAALQEAGI